MENTSENIKNRIGKQHNIIPNLILAVITPHTRQCVAKCFKFEFVFVNTLVGARAVRTNLDKKLNAEDFLSHGATIFFSWEAVYTHNVMKWLNW